MKNSCYDDEKGIGSGSKKIFKYTLLYFDGKEPVIDEQKMYSVTTPIQPFTTESVECSLLFLALCLALSLALSWELVRLGEQFWRIWNIKE